jgi:gluconokinase
VKLSLNSGRAPYSLIAVSDFVLRSPGATVGGLVYFGRMLDKIRAHQQRSLPPDYEANLGRGFDEFCAEFLRINYSELVERVHQGGSDEEILAWCFARGCRPSAGEIFVWNDFMRKRGWEDDISDTLTRRKKDTGMAGRSEIRTMFEFIDADEGRPHTRLRQDVG